MRRFGTCLLACLAALAVFTVLITPAFDELPSTAPHPAHSFAAPVAVVFTSIVLTVLDKLPVHFGRVVDGKDLLRLTCSRLC
jgi:hypothetical protein